MKSQQTGKSTFERKSAERETAKNFDIFSIVVRYSTIPVTIIAIINLTQRFYPDPTHQIVRDWIQLSTGTV
jgi:hypothetical protein